MHFGQGKKFHDLSKIKPGVQKLF